MTNNVFHSSTKVLLADSVTQFALARDGRTLTYAEVLDLWATNPAFCDWFSQVFIDAEFEAYRWETPALTSDTLDRPFEFVLVNTPGFVSRLTDSSTYAGYFTDDDSTHGIVSFTNLGGDATLVVPSPRTSEEAYGHLAAFVRRAPREQTNALWPAISRALQGMGTSKPVWLNTAGGGVAWLHVRLDSRPKYYRHKPYRISGT